MHSHIPLLVMFYLSDQSAVCVHSHIPLLVMFYQSDQSVICLHTYTLLLVMFYMSGQSVTNVHTYIPQLVMFYLSDQSVCTVTYHYWRCFTWVISQCAQWHTITGDVLPEWSVSVHSDIPLLAMFYLSDQSVCTVTYHYWRCFTWVISQRAQRQTITGNVLPEWSVSVHSDIPLLVMFYLSDQSAVCVPPAPLSLPRWTGWGPCCGLQQTWTLRQKDAVHTPTQRKQEVSLKYRLCMYKNKSAELLSYTMNCYNIILSTFLISKQNQYSTILFTRYCY